MPLHGLVDSHSMVSHRPAWLPAPQSPPARNPFIDETLFTRPTHPRALTKTNESAFHLRRQRDDLTPYGLTTTTTTTVTDPLNSHEDAGQFGLPPSTSKVTTLYFNSLLLSSPVPTRATTSPGDRSLGSGKQPDFSPDMPQEGQVGLSLHSNTSRPHTPLFKSTTTSNTSVLNTHRPPVDPSLMRTASPLPRPPGPALLRQAYLKRSSSHLSLLHVSSPQLSPRTPTHDFAIPPTTLSMVSDPDDFDPALDVGSIVTDTEATATEEKLGQPASERQRELIQGYLDQLKSFIVRPTPSDPLLSPETTSSPTTLSENPWGNQVVLLVNFFSVGVGSLHVGSEYLCWTGTLPALMAQDLDMDVTAASISTQPSEMYAGSDTREAQSSATSSPTTKSMSTKITPGPKIKLGFPFRKLGNVRYKHLSEQESMVLCTLNGRLSLQLMLGSDVASLREGTEILSNRLRGGIQTSSSTSTPCTPRVSSWVSAPTVDLTPALSTMEYQIEQADRIRDRLHQYQKERNDLIEAAQQQYESKLRSLHKLLSPHAKKQWVLGSPGASECTLCYAELQTHIIRPCGHTLCQACAEQLGRMDTQQCPWDRSMFTTIEQRDL
ncbi:hypothetical protein IWQ61_009215 [Dispira simplex]|nr:hypothetical protein IWQ61_009215 [Dispira simplex]